MEHGRFRYYVVRRGREPGIYTIWEECNQQVFGFKGSEHKGFMVRSVAEAWFELRKKDSEVEKTVMRSKELEVRFGEPKVGESMTVAAEGSNESGSRATNLLLHEQEFDKESFVLVEDMEQLLLKVCEELNVGPPVFFLRDGYRMGGEDYHGFGVYLQSHSKGINFFVSGRVSTDQKWARRDAAFITLERLLEEAEVKSFYFNYQVALRFKEQAAEARRMATMFVPERVAILEQENANLKRRLELFTHMFR
ncbi:hypothetical protein Ahy_A07g032038 [Arachis hypogaea]|uniref:Ribonuclease H1 N-terminal domain-containing protein n=1 Tax=Arachis hypogaea TaxID=3818 RepID=A0A445C5Y6_ARAHY|nr:hypothetical protein Ahy_A07g032038 [Arachis hypogaea]